MEILLIIGAIGVIVGILVQRIGEIMIGNWRTSIAEIMLYTFLIAMLCSLLPLIG
jgi:hypothetical protein